MNERIEQLALEAGEYVNKVYTGPVRSKTPGKIWENGHIDWHTQFNQKFAELIVKECAGVADHSNVTGKSIIGQRIKEHFGVEE